MTIEVGCVGRDVVVVRILACHHSTLCERRDRHPSPPYLFNPALRGGPCEGFPYYSLHFSTMTSMADVPPYMLPGVPVVQPPHLEGLSDPSLSTEILPGPPSLLSVQQAAHKRDPKKPGAFVSYLPASDPGSTYSGLMGSAFNSSDAEGQRRKRARVDKGYVLFFRLVAKLIISTAVLRKYSIFVPPQPLPRRPSPAYSSQRTTNGRAQRASARKMNSGVVPASDPIIPEAPSRPPSIPPLPDSDSFPINPCSGEPSVSRATSDPTFDEPFPPQAPPPVISNGRGRPRKDKGKGKETDKHSVKVKEEPATTFSLSPDPQLALVSSWSLSYDHTPHYRVV